MKKKIKNSYIHFLIGMAIMIAFRFIPLGVLPNVTEVGLQVMGVFIGTIYLWSTIDPTVASLASIFMLTFTSFSTSNNVLMSCFGNPTVVQLLFLMIFMGGLTNRRLTVYIARWITTRKMIEGRPWVFTFVMLLGTYVMSVFIGAFAPIFLFWPVLYGIFEEVGFKKKDTYPKLMIIGIVIAALIGFPVPPYMSNGLALLGNYRGLLNNFPTLMGMEGVLVSDASYFIGCFTLGLLLIVATVLIIKFIFRPDVSPLKKISIEMLEKNPLPPMSMAQKVYGIFLCVFIFIMLVPSLLPNVPILSFLNKNSLVMPLVLTCILTLLEFDDGPVLKLNEVMGKDFAWATFFLCTSAILLGSVLTNEATGITAFLNAVLSPIFSGMSGMMFTIVLLLMAIILTNICNSLVIGMILQPVALTYCVNAGVNPAPIITLLIFTVLLSAACTPAASPFAAMMFGNKEYLSSGDVYKYSTVFVVIEFVIIIIVGIPFINLLF
ncbi:MAG: SLC13 family permease [Beduini sp.]|uniref:SLC13 family permease n=1 Tax=Beduini sp. TaxID=1922300 RepID=UPI0011CC4756